MTQFDMDKEVLNWLLEPENVGVRYLALRDLVGIPADDAELISARKTAISQGPVMQILQAMNPEGWWERPGPGYNPKYRSSVWSIIMLAQLGVSVNDDERIHLASRYMLDHALAENGQFSYSGSAGGTFDCLQGNLCKSLQDLGVDDSRLEKAFDWMARTVTGEGIAPLTEKKAPIRYTAYQCGPLFACGANLKQSCAWGAVKVMSAFGSLPRSKWTPEIQKAVKAGLEFFLSIDPSTAAYPSGNNEKPNRSWWKFGFPNFYVTDILQLTEAILQTSESYDSRLDNVIQFIQNKQDDHGHWKMEYNYSGKTWVDWGRNGIPNKWVTLRALRTLKLAGIVRF